VEAKGGGGEGVAIMGKWPVKSPGRKETGCGENVAAVVNQEGGPRRKHLWRKKKRQEVWIDKTRKRRRSLGEKRSNGDEKKFEGGNCSVPENTHSKGEKGPARHR